MKNRAFTLMEILVALAIVGLIAAGSMIAVGSLNDERDLRAPLNELRIMAKKSWARSMEEQRAWQIKLLPDRFVLEPKQPIHADDLKLFKEVDEQMKRGSGIDSYVIDPSVKMESYMAETSTSVKDHVVWKERIELHLMANGLYSGILDDQNQADKKTVVARSLACYVIISINLTDSCREI